jgi:transcriptional regulator with XRE-family HTH domain
MAKPKTGRSAAAIDDHVGGRIRERRIMLGLTQKQLAEMIGVTYQQAHKYERGINRVSAGRLFKIARALSAPITYFYEGIGEEGPRQLVPHQRMQLEIDRAILRGCADITAGSVPHLCPFGHHPRKRGHPGKASAHHPRP